MAWGALFGAVGGAGYALAAALIAALLGFAVGRWLGRDFVAERVRGRLARLDGWFARQSVLGVITVRLLPLGGFGLVELRVRHHRRAAAGRTCWAACWPRCRRRSATRPSARRSARPAT